MIQSPYQKYQQAQAQTASKPKLLIMLYDGAIRFTRAGIDGILDKDFGKANYNLCKSQAIIHELISALNFDYPISQDLLRIYEYMLHCLIESNVHKDVSKAREVEEHLTDLREAWVEISKLPSSVTGS
ncbi:flagellar export chaperone FliS [Paenibacillus polymyxa]|uniref:Flagellar secretion chaperone FliS n=1 Tax=Paenibacillus polymyxa TaxID=1406 RepID=A0A378Y4V0_PAEPO|nr:flagellar export chaperone FliS [Paenibacillus polymyxa]MBE7898979.1 flagellar export chaperone FliS [Paenibacillus polymyxa]MBG9763709.1 flagellar biosynthesis protein FliS [Paenibacillus polymyxa]MCC3259788.1 flagellar export chaperone FliS [Paenibacillus polymyxa]QPK53170.1 flagellar export chaperone FliS [Paenibacillus polymyxa]QPK58250.1 flagellar export chaperone FliS [Paenibacillus polymyxa]